MNPESIHSSSLDDKPYRTSFPNKNDVLCGRGGTINSHPGNEQYRSMVDSKKRVYVTARFKREKRLIATSIVEQIRSMDPPGRFLQKDMNSKTWVDIGVEKSREKTSQALRENARDVRTQLENEYYEARRREQQQVWQQVAVTAAAAGHDPDADEEVEAVSSAANAHWEKQKHLHEQQQQLAQQQQEIAWQQEQLAQQQQVLAQRNVQLHQLKQLLVPSAYGHGVSSQPGSFYNQQNPHPQSDQQYNYDQFYGSTTPSQEQMMPCQQPQEQRMSHHQHVASSSAQDQQQIMPTPQKSLSHQRTHAVDPLAQQQPMFHGGSDRHVQFQTPVGLSQGHTENFEVGSGIPLLIKSKKRNRSRKLPPSAMTSSENSSNYLPPKSPRGPTGVDGSPDASVSSATTSAMSGALTAKTDDSLSHYLRAMEEEEISGDVGQEVELVLHGPMSSSSSKPLPRSPKGSTRKHGKSKKNRFPLNNGKIQVDWTVSPIVLTSKASTPSHQKSTFSPVHSLDLMSLAGTENISQASSVGGASLVNVFGDNALSQLSPSSHRMALGDQSASTTSLGFSHTSCDQDNMMDISVQS